VESRVGVRVGRVCMVGVWCGECIGMCVCVASECCGMCGMRERKREIGKEKG
jgi:hypothetical protein